MTTGDPRVAGTEPPWADIPPQHNTMPPEVIAALIDRINGLTAPEDIRVILTEMFGFMLDHHRDCTCHPERDVRVQR